VRVRTKCSHRGCEEEVLRNVQSEDQYAVTTISFVHPIDLQRLSKQRPFVTVDYATFCKRYPRRRLYMAVQHLPPSISLFRRIWSIQGPNLHDCIVCRLLNAETWQRYEETHPSFLPYRGIERAKRLLDGETRQEVLVALGTKPARACIGRLPSIEVYRVHLNAPLQGRRLFLITNLNTISLFSMLCPLAQSVSSFPIVT
jgi:hypothetical protein